MKPIEATKAGAADIAIKVESLSKCYHIYDNPRDRLKQFFVPCLQRLIWQAPKQYFQIILGAERFFV